MCTVQHSSKSQHALRAVEEAKCILLAVDSPGVSSDATEEKPKNVFDDVLPLHEGGVHGCTFLPVTLDSSRAPLVPVVRRFLPKEMTTSFSSVCLDLGNGVLKPPRGSSKTPSPSSRTATMLASSLMPRTRWTSLLQHPCRPEGRVLRRCALSDAREWCKPRIQTCHVTSDRALYAN